MDLKTVRARCAEARSIFDVACADGGLETIERAFRRLQAQRFPDVNYLLPAPVLKCFLQRESRAIFYLGPVETFILALAPIDLAFRASDCPVRREAESVLRSVSWLCALAGTLHPNADGFRSILTSEPLESLLAESDAFCVDPMDWLRFRDAYILGTHRGLIVPEREEAPLDRLLGVHPQSVATALVERMLERSMLFTGKRSAWYVFHNNDAQALPWLKAGDRLKDRSDGYLADESLLNELPGGAQGFQAYWREQSLRVGKALGLSNRARSRAVREAGLTHTEAADPVRSAYFQVKRLRRSIERTDAEG
jgi:hypothetical protein